MKRITKIGLTVIGILAITLPVSATVYIVPQGGTGLLYPTTGFQSGKCLTGNGTGPIATTTCSTGTDNVSTSSPETSGDIPFWTTNSATPARLSGGYPGFSFSHFISNETMDVGNYSSPGGTGTLNLGDQSTSGGGGNINSDGYLNITSGADFNINSIFDINNGLTTFVNASSSVLSATALCLSTDCRTVWPPESTSPVATSSHEVAGRLSYWTSNSGTPALLGQVSTTSVSCSGTASCTSFTAIGPSPITITGTGGSGTVTSVATNNGLTGGTITTTGTLGLDTTSLSPNALIGWNAVGNDITATGTPTIYVGNIFATSSGLLSVFFGRVAIGTTTTPWPFTIFSASQSQLTLSSGAGIAQWAFRSIGGNLYFATTTVAGIATSTTSALTIIGTTGFTGIATTTPWGQLSVSSISSSPALAVEQKSTGPAAVFLGGNTGFGSTSPSGSVGIQGSTGPNSGNVGQPAIMAFSGNGHAGGGPTAGGTGGSNDIISGGGGAGGTTGGGGGDVIITAGTGGNGSATGGSAGNVTISAGGGGSGGTVARAGGNITLNPGNGDGNLIPPFAPGNVLVETGVSNWGNLLVGTTSSVARFVVQASTTLSSSLGTLPPLGAVLFASTTGTTLWSMDENGRQDYHYSGLATMSSGSTSAITPGVLIDSNSLIFVSLQNCVTCGTPYISATTSSTFTISSTNILDASNVAWQVIQNI